MIDYEISHLRDDKKALTPDANFDATYNFYYDETNNVRKFYVRANDFNCAFESNFVLGGLLHEGNPPDVKPLIDIFMLPNTVQEVKFKYIANGDFLECLTSVKLKLFLQFVKDSDLYVHYSSLNFLYWSIVDIVDSAVVHSDAAQKLGMGYVLFLKDTLYKLIKLEIDSVIELFYHYNYPNIKKEEILSFIDDLVSLFDDYINDIEFHFGLESLRQILKEAGKKGTLPFIMDEVDHILIESLSTFYLGQITTFKNSNHIFDKEDSIMQLLNSYRILDDGKEVHNYSFVDSKTNQLVQLSDVFVGLMGKLSKYLNTSTIEKIEEDFDIFTDLQETNIDLLLDVLDKSFDKNIGLIHRAESQGEWAKMDYIRKLQMRF